MNRRWLSGTGLLLATGLFVALVSLSNALLTGQRLDLTEGRLYTLSDGTRNILAGLDEPITLRLYYSGRLFADVPQVASYGDRVRDLLAEYVTRSDGRLRLTVIDPEPFSEAEEEAVALGISQLPVGPAGEMGYFGLVGSNSTDDEQLIPVFQPAREDALEFELTRLVHALAHPQKRRVGVMSWLPGYGSGGGAPATLATLMRETYDVRQLATDARTIESDIDTLVLIHPKDVGRQTLYAIDQFVLHGGEAMVFVDPLAEEDPVQPDPQSPLVLPRRDSALPELFARWGLELVPEKIVVDAPRSLRVQYQGSRGQQEIEFLPWMGITEDGLSSEDFVTSELARVNVGNAGELTPLEGAGTRFEPLLSTGAESMLLERDAVLFQRDPGRLLSLWKPEPRRRVVAARVTGEFATAFPDGRPKVEGRMEADPDFIARATEPVSLVVVADTDILADRFWVRFQGGMGGRAATPIADNADFVMNALDSLSGSSDLVSLRSRGAYARPFDRVLELRREAEARFRDEERALQRKLEEAERRITELSQQQGEAGAVLLSPEQRAAIEGFRREQVETRRQLRAVQHELQRNIESLGNVLRFINIGLVPLVILTLALGATLVRARRAAARARIS